MTALFTDFPFLSQKKNRKASSFILDNSMLPFIKSCSKISTQPVPINQVRTGDLIALWQKGYFQIRRVVKRVGRPDITRLVVKADNRAQHDPIIESSRKVDLVIQVNSKNLTTRSAHLFGWCVAQLSYLPRLFQPILVYNRVRLFFVRKKMTSFPGVYSKSIEYRNLKEKDIDELVHLWNQCFPKHQTDVLHFKNKICTSAWYDPESKFFATKGGKIIGFVLASPRRFHSGKAFRQKIGYVESIGVDSEERRSGVGSALLSMAMQYLRQKNCRIVKISHFPLESDDEIKMIGSGSFQFLKQFEFELSCLSRLLTLIPENWDNSIADRLVDRVREKQIIVRQACSEDRQLLENALKSWNQPWPNYDDTMQNNLNNYIGTYIIAHQNKRIIGYCRAILQEDIDSYDEHEWIWDAATVQPRGYLGSLYVDSHFRHLGLGAMLLAKSFNILFERGSEEIRTFTDQRALQIRVLRWGMKPDGCVLSMARKN